LSAPLVFEHCCGLKSALRRGGRILLGGGNNTRRESAFTLIEMMVVIVVIGIMTAALLPEMRGSYEDALLRATSRDVINVCHLAYSRAVSLNQVHRVQLDERTGHYFIEKRIRETDMGGDFVAVKDISGCEGKLDSRIRIQIREAVEEHSPGAPPRGTEGLGAASTGEAGGRPAMEEAALQQAPESGTLLDLNQGIVFNPDGTADAREIRLRDREGFRLGLRINPVTARIRVVELPRE
jgi:prepilin-type N-terminal cleavage/methylation domain-containing protein